VFISTCQSFTKGEQAEHEFEDEEEKYKDDEYENEITYLEMDDHSLIRRLVTTWWFPCLAANYQYLTRIKQLKKLKTSQAIKVWHYSELAAEQWNRI